MLNAYSWSMCEIYWCISQKTLLKQTFNLANFQFPKQVTKTFPCIYERTAWTELAWHAKMSAPSQRWTLELKHLTDWWYMVYYVLIMIGANWRSSGSIWPKAVAMLDTQATQLSHSIVHCPARFLTPGPRNPVWPGCCAFLMFVCCRCVAVYCFCFFFSLFFCCYCFFDFLAVEFLLFVCVAAVLTLVVEHAHFDR